MIWTVQYTVHFYFADSAVCYIKPRCETLFKHVIQRFYLLMYSDTLFTFQAFKRA